MARGVLVGCVLLALGAALARAETQVWVADSLTRVFADTLPPKNAPAEISLQAARGEYESAQIAVRSAAPLKQLSARASDLRAAGSSEVIPASCLRVRFVGFVRVEKNTPRTPPEELERAAPADFPEPLLEDAARDVAANATQPIWLTVAVPRGAVPDRYVGEVELTCASGKIGAVPVALEVWPFEVPRERHMFFTNWFSVSRLCRRYGVKAYSEEFFKIFERFVADLGAHRQNVLIFDPAAVQITEDEQGELSFDFSRLDRWVEICERYGVADRIEIGHLARHKGDWSAKEYELRKFPVFSKKTGKTEWRAGEEVLPQYLPALVNHLRERGWLEKAMVHIGDEPAPHNIDSWRKLSAWVHEQAPELRRIDAIEAPDFGDDLEVWVPKLTHYDNWREQYEQARLRGKELWYYTCLHPTGRYPNRFVDFPLIKTRILHWLNWRYNLVGYLHWGLLAWTEDPFAGFPAGKLPPGDAWIIYPGKQGPLDSLRWEALRDGIEDYEYLWLLTEGYREAKRKLGRAAADIDPKHAADYYARLALPGFKDYLRKPYRLLGLRRAIAEEIAAAREEPLLVVDLSGPEPRWKRTVVVVRGAVSPGASVAINGEPVPVSAIGRFVREITVSEGDVPVTIEARLGGKRKVLKRIAFASAEAPTAQKQ